MKTRRRYSFVLTAGLLAFVTLCFSGSAFSMTDTPSQVKSIGQQTDWLVAYFVDTSKEAVGKVPVQPIKESPMIASHKTVDEAVSMLFLGITLLVVAGITRKRAIYHQGKKQSRIENAQLTG